MLGDSLAGFTPDKKSSKLLKGLACWWYSMWDAWDGTCYPEGSEAYNFYGCQNTNNYNDAPPTGLYPGNSGSSDCYIKIASNKQGFTVYPNNNFKRVEGDENIKYCQASCSRDYCSDKCESESGCKAFAYKGNLCRYYTTSNVFVEEVYEEWSNSYSTNYGGKYQYLGCQNQNGHNKNRQGGSLPNNKPSPSLGLEFGNPSEEWDCYIKSSV